MKSKRFTDEQIIAVLKEGGAKTKDLRRKHGISDATFYNWKAKFAEMRVSEARRLKELLAESEPCTLRGRQLSDRDADFDQEIPVVL